MKQVTSYSTIASGIGLVNHWVSLYWNSYQRSHFYAWASCIPFWRSNLQVAAQEALDEPFQYDYPQIYGLWPIQPFPTVYQWLNMLYSTSLLDTLSFRNQTSRRLQGSTWRAIPAYQRWDIGHSIHQTTVKQLQKKLYSTFLILFRGNLEGVIKKKPNFRFIGFFSRNFSLTLKKVPGHLERWGLAQMTWFL